MRFFQILSRRQREMKIARVTILELATRQVKKSLEKVPRIEIFHDKIAEIVARVATLQLSLEIASSSYAIARETPGYPRL